MKALSLVNTQEDYIKVLYCSLVASGAMLIRNNAWQVGHLGGGGGADQGMTTTDGARRNYCPGDAWLIHN